MSDAINDSNYHISNIPYEVEKSSIIKTPKEDLVNHPNHYNQYGMETIKAIEKQSTPNEFRGYLKGNILKYVARYRFKNGCEDLEKADFYINKLIEFERIRELQENGRVKK